MIYVKVTWGLSGAGLGWGGLCPSTHSHIVILYVIKMFTTFFNCDAVQIFLFDTGFTITESEYGLKLGRIFFSLTSPMSSDRKTQSKCYVCSSES